VGFRNKGSSFPPAVRAFEPARKPPLPHSENILRLLKEAGILYLLPFRGGEERLATHIYSYGLASLREWSARCIITREAYIPFARRCPLNSNGLNIPLNRSGETKLEPAYVSDRKTSMIKPPARLFQGETIIPVSTLKSREPRVLAILNTPKECFVGFVQPLKHILKHLRAYIFIFRERCFEFGKLLHLGVAGYTALILMVDSNALLKGSIIKSATKSEPMIGFLENLWICPKAVFEGLFHLPSTMFNIAYFKGGVKRAFISPLKGWGFLPAIL